jgi:ABC-type bacteriocin/lantibiotic exporter with double-glycine peptidase domain
MPRAALLVALAVAGLGCYTGSARTVSTARVAELARDPSWRMARDVPFVAQRSDRDCGPAALAMVLAHFGAGPAPIDNNELAAGDVRAGALRDVARARGLQAYVVAGTMKDLQTQLERGRPVLVGLAKPMSTGRALAHYEVVVGMSKQQRKIVSLDPAVGVREYSLEGFAREWVPTRRLAIVFLPPDLAARWDSWH